MTPLLKSVVPIGMLCWFSFSGFTQDKASPNISLRAGGGNSISIKHFSHDETSLNIPGSPFINIGISTNVGPNINRSLFLGLEVQALSYYPTLNEKSNLAFVSLLAGRTARRDLAQGLYMKYTAGISFGTLAEVSSSVYGFDAYSGGPLKNGNLGIFNNLQVMFSQNRCFDYGLGFDLGLNGITLYSDELYPAYLKRNGFLQYGISGNVNYNFRKRRAQQ